MTCKIRFTVAACGVLAWPVMASASVIDHNMLGQNQSSASLELGDLNVSVQSVGGDFLQKTVAGYAATGISGGSVNGEIDGSQAISFAFDRPTMITSLTVAFLYTAGNHGDLWNEVALFTTDLGSFTLEAAGATNANWNGFGLASNDSPGVEGGGGMWTISGSDIFGGPITSLMLSSGNPGSHAKYGDFSFRSMSYAVIPAPGMAGLLIAGLVFGTSRRRSTRC